MINLGGFNMSNIYVVTAGSLDDYHVVTTCSNKAIAEKICSICGPTAQVEEYPDIEMMDLDSPVYLVTIENPTSTKGLTINIVEMMGESKIDILIGTYYKLNEIITQGNTCKSIYVQAPNEEMAYLKAKQLINEK